VGVGRTPPGLKQKPGRWGPTSTLSPASSFFLSRRRLIRPDQIGGGVVKRCRPRPHGASNPYDRDDRRGGGGGGRSPPRGFGRSPPRNVQAGLGGPPERSERLVARLFIVQNVGSFVLIFLQREPVSRRHPPQSPRSFSHPLLAFGFQQNQSQKNSDPKIEPQSTTRLGIKIK